MMKCYLSLFVGLVLLVTVVACAPGTNNRTPLNDHPIAEDDASADASKPVRAEPPPATLTIAGRAQQAGLTSYCWQIGDGTGICADAYGVRTERDPILVGSPFRAEFAVLLDDIPGRMGLAIFPASRPVEMAPEESEWRYWTPVPGEDFTLPLSKNPSIELTLDPGLYVFHLFVGWPDYGDVSYGFLVKVEDVVG